MKASLRGRVLVGCLLVLGLQAIIRSAAAVEPQPTWAVAIQPVANDLPLDVDELPPGAEAIQPAVDNLPPAADANPSAVVANPPAAIVNPPAAAGTANKWLVDTINQRLKAWKVNEDVNFPDTAKAIAEIYARDTFQFNGDDPAIIVVGEKPNEKTSKTSAMIQFENTISTGTTEVLSKLPPTAKRRWEGFLKDLEKVRYDYPLQLGAENETEAGKFGKMEGHQTLAGLIARVLEASATNDEAAQASRLEQNIKTYSAYMQSYQQQNPQRRRRGCIQILLGL